MSWKNTGFGVALAIGLVADQASKAWARTAPALQSGDGWAISERFLHLVHRENTGAAFSVLEGMPGGAMIGLIVFNAIAIAMGLWLLLRTPSHRWIRGTALGLFVAGAMGNGIDRLFRGSVTDFIRVHADVEPIHGLLMRFFSRADGPVFNVADVLLIIGVVVVLLRDRIAARSPLSPTGGLDAPAG